MSQPLVAHAYRNQQGHNCLIAFSLLAFVAIYQFLEPHTIEPEHLRDIGIVMFVDIPRRKRHHVKSLIMPPLSRQLLEEYGKRQGYDVWIETNATIGESYLNSGRRPHWGKVAAVQKWLPKYRWILCVDSDAYVMNLSTRIESLIDEDYDIILANDTNTYNTGVVLFKNTPFTINFLKSMWLVPAELVTKWEDQSALIYLLELEQSQISHFKVLEARSMNSFPRELTSKLTQSNFYREGDYICHFAGLRGTKEVIRLYYCAALAFNHITTPLINCKKIFTDLQNGLRIGVAIDDDK